jgi:hypothetical protein
MKHPGTKFCRSKPDSFYSFYKSLCAYHDTLVQAKILQNPPPKKNVSYKMPEAFKKGFVALRPLMKLTAP